MLNFPDEKKIIKKYLNKKYFYENDFKNIKNKNLDNLFLKACENYKEKVSTTLTTTGLRITKKDGVEDSWEHESDYSYHKFYPLIQDYPVLMQLLNWFGTDWKKLLEVSP